MYAQKCMGEELPRTYIRMDVAHYIKTWANFLKSEKHQFKKFYLLGIGQLIQCNSLTKAEKIIKALLVIALSTTSGDGATSLKNSLDFINNLIKQESPANSTIAEITESILTEQKEHENEETNDIEPNEDIPQEFTLKKWAEKIEGEVDIIISKEKGDDWNPRECPHFAKRLLKHLLTIPLWSSICREEFGYGRIPASSASVESTFNTIKNKNLLKVKRLDVAVEDLIKYNNGKLKIIDCCNKSKKSVPSKKNKREKLMSAALPDASENLPDSINITDNDKNSLEATNNYLEEIPPVPKKASKSTTKMGNKRKAINLTDTSLDKMMSNTGEKTIRVHSTPNSTTFAANKSCTPSENSLNTIDDVPQDSDVLETSSILEKSSLIDLTNTIHFKSSCDKCNAGNNPGDDFKCHLCNENVHASPGCSTSTEEDGQRICESCFNSSTKEIKIAYKEQENWRNLASKKETKKRNTYLGKTNQDLLDVATSSKARVLPILKNGNIMMGFIYVGKLRLSVTNTCAFDSIFQVLLAGVTDHSELLKYVQSKKSRNHFFQMIINVFEKKISQKTYQERGEILAEFKNVTKTSNQIIDIDCKCNASELTNFLFKSTPCFVATATCPSGCAPRVQSFTTITLVVKELRKPLGNVIKDHVVLPGAPCVQEGCQKRSKKSEKNALHSIGKTCKNIGKDTYFLKHKFLHLTHSKLVIHT